MSFLSPPPQNMLVNLEFSLPVNLAHLRDADQLHAPIAFAAPLALGFVFIARAFAVAALPPDQSSAGAGRRSRRSAGPDPQRSGPDLSAVLEQLNVRGKACQALVICETHRLLANLPQPLLHQYRRVSGRLSGMHRFSGPATLGLDGGECHTGDDRGCGKTPLQLLLGTGLLRQRRRSL